MRIAGIIAVIFCSTYLFGQSQLGTGSISGVVEDSTGGVIPGANVTITNTETGLVRQLGTGEAGQFFAPVLPIGAYNIRVTKAGFAGLEQTGVAVTVGGVAAVTLHLKVGDLEETVSVQAAAETIDPSQTDISSLVDRTEVN